MIRMQLPPFTLGSDSVRGRTILVTGATSGLGRALSLTLAQHGATVILSGRNARKLDHVYDEIVTRQGPQPAIAPLDLATATAQDYDALAAVIEAEFPALDGLVHAAALLGERAPLEQYDVPTWCRVLHVNLTAPLILTQVLLPQLRKSTGASVLFVSSGVAHDPPPYWGAYAVSKAGLEAVRTMFAKELATVSTVRFNSVSPGPLRTPMRAAAFPAEDPNTLPTPESVCDALLYLLGTESRAINGAFVSLTKR
jgi:NAD(P)-dependent dehydrogenase (short-subunit alcohol dehydrogenase family)